MIETKLILFDFDGTLADSLQENFRIANKLATKFDIRIAEKSELEKLRGMTAQEIIKHFKIPFYKLPFIVKAYYDYRTASTPGVYKGIKAVLESLKEKGYKLSVVTSNSEERIKDFFVKHDITFFDSIRSEKNFFGKDKAIKRELAKFNIQPAEAFYVGDEVRDIEAARKAGIKIVSVTWGFNTKKLLTQNKPDYIVDIPSNLLKIL